MSSGRFSNAFRLRMAALALGAATALFGAAAQPALATHFKQSPNGSNPLTIFIGNDGWFQQLVAGNTDNSFFPRSQPQTSDVSANAGFVLAFPSPQTGPFTALQGQVWGWNPNPSSNGPSFDGTFTPVSQTSWSGTGTSGDPYSQITKYEVKPASTSLVEVTQTTSYINGESNFVNSYGVKNLDSTDPVKFRAMIGADVYLNGSDCGSGIFKLGPPRFVGGSSQGRVGGFTEAATAWSHYFEGPYGGPPGACETNPSGAQGVWQYLQGADTGGGFPDTVDPGFVDNGIGVQWDNYFTSGLAAGLTGNFQLNTLGTVPGELTLAPSNQWVNAPSPTTLTATATDSASAPAPGIVVRFTSSGANSATSAVATDAAGKAVFNYTPTSGGVDTITAFEDLDGNGVRGAGELMATAIVTVAPPAAPPGSEDKSPPKITLIVSSKAKLKKFLKGLTVAAKVSEAASLKVELLGSKSKRAKTFTRKLASQKLPMAGAGLRATRLRPSKKKVGTAKKFVVQLRVTATDRAGNTAVVTKKIKVR
jgi:hypothetical protein